MRELDRNKSLQQLEGQDWGKPTFDSHPVTECQRLRQLRLGEFTVEDLRIMIGQNIGLEHLVPLAFERLQDEPFAEGAYYPCDLLVSVLRAEPRFWQANPELRKRLVAITDGTTALFPAMPEVASEIVTQAVKEAYEEFQRRQRA